MSFHDHTDDNDVGLSWGHIERGVLMLTTMPDRELASGERISEEQLAAKARELAVLLNDLPLPPIPSSPSGRAAADRHSSGR
jgi:hypothetical protein